MVAMNMCLVLAALATVPSALGHGWQVMPPGRQLRDCGWEDSLNFLYPAGTGGGGTYEFSGGFPGLCGDGFMNRERNDMLSTFHELPCQLEPPVYEEGGELLVEWMVIAPHGGFWKCNICDDASNLSEECFNQNPLTLVENGEDRWYLFDELSETVTKKMNWQLPAGLTCEHCTVQCTWWTGTHCYYPCNPEVCDWYADGVNNLSRPPGHRAHGVQLPECDSMKPGPGEKPQMFRNCGDITIVPGDGSNGPTAGPDSDAPASDETTVEATSEETFVEEVEPATPAAGPSDDGMLLGLAIVDVEDGSSEYLEHMAADSITVSAYPAGFSIRAEVVDDTLVAKVTFSTSEGYSHTELHQNYNMFGSKVASAWPNPPVGSMVTVTVVATMKDGTVEEIETDLTFE